MDTRLMAYAAPGESHTGAREERTAAAEPRTAPGVGRCEADVRGPDEDIFDALGERLKIADGDVYVCRKGQWLFSQSMVRPAVKHIEIRKTAKGCEMVDPRTGAKRVLGNNFSSGFEARSFRGLFYADGWSSTALLSPKVDSVRKYTELHGKLMRGGGFLDNRIDLETREVHSGNKALRFYAVPPSPGLGTSKSLVENSTLCFSKGDHIWFSGWYYIEKGMPATLVDFETRRFLGGPGMRLMIRRNKYATMELKFLEKTPYNQYKVALPRQKWFHIKVHLWLSNHDDGIIELWQDGKKILHTTGQTLPTHDTIYNALQVGITATPRETVLIVDDVIISDKPL
jgi:hypothetical protein